MSNIAERIWDGERAHHELYNKLIEIFGGTEEDSESWPCGDVGTDCYDGSVEMKDAKDGLKATPAQQDAIYELGFCRFWICYGQREEQRERYYVHGSRECVVKHGEIILTEDSNSELPKCEQPM